MLHHAQSYLLKKLPFLKYHSNSRFITNWSYINKLGKEPLKGITLGQVLDQAAKLYGSREAVIFRHQNIRKTYSQLKTDVDKFAAGLLAIGLEKGDRLGLWSPNYYEWVVTQLAAAKAGLILVNVNPAYQPMELEYCLNKVGVRGIVAAESFKTQDYYKMLTSLVPSLPKSRAGEVRDRLEKLSHVIMISEKEHGGAFKFSDVCNASQQSHVNELEKLQSLIEFDDPLCIMFTSGTTGAPKGATLSHFALINNAVILGKILGYHEEAHRFCIPLPLYHAFGCVGGPICGTIFGACQVYPSVSFNGKDAAQAMSEEKCTSLYGTPTMFIDILNLPDINEYDFSNCKTGVMGGAICPAEIVKLAIEKFKHISLCYGATECGPGVTVTYPQDSYEKKTTTVGSVYDHTEVKIVDPQTLKMVPVGQPGEIWVRSIFIMREYWNDSEKTGDVVTKDKWYRTGDLAITDEDGYIKIVGRIKDMIIRGGENIYPREIEELLHTHPKIAEAHVVGVPDKRLGEELCAWVQLKADQSLSEHELKEFCKGKLSHFKIPRYIKFVETFPMTVTGKVQKFIFRKQAANELKLDQ